MSDIQRFSSRRQRLDHAFFSARLRGAKSCLRIAGCFRSSIFELVGEAIASITKVQIVCNSKLLETGQIPQLPKVGRHRRVMRIAVLKYKRNRDAQRESALKELAVL
ncbi:MAG: hypothetical protein A3H35_00170 [Betaproteobacteria bacterium RIFCSPLOWO2_02_FULL_62_17]|nr:MAG: hypothetical protein A3H35_00170 [Betaproteobacteria bacterium RIFCSPLOWO2_02_FULL_62_17]